MLKIGKQTLGSSDISLEFQKKEVFFDRIFLRALSIAVFLHLMALLIFHVGPFKLVNNGLLPPAIVETDILETDTQVATNIQLLRKISRTPFAPKISRPKLPSIPNLVVIDHLENIEDFSSLDNPFLKVERELTNDLIFSKEEIKEEKPRVQIILTNALERKKMILEKDLEGVFPKDKFFRAIYNVKVENKTGNIFFVEEESSMFNNPEINRVGQLLKKIQFEKDNKGFITSGQIEIVLNEGL